MKAFLLAAGLGKRLRPLTERTPKPLIPIRGVPLIFFALARLRRAGIVEIGVNLHHLGEQIAEALGTGENFGLRIRYFREPVLLGTGGAIRNAREFLSDGPFLLWNADTVLDLDPAALAQEHSGRGGIATLALSTSASLAEFGGIRYDERGRMLGLQGRGAPPAERAAVFAGASVLEPRIFESLAQGGEAPCVLRHGVLPAIESGETAWISLGSGAFADLGTPQRLEEVQEALDREGPLRRLWEEARRLQEENRPRGDLRNDSHAEA